MLHGEVCHHKTLHTHFTVGKYLGCFRELVLSCCYPVIPFVKQEKFMKLTLALAAVQRFRHPLIIPSLSRASSLCLCTAVTVIVQKCCFLNKVN